MHSSWKGVVGTLRHVDVIVWMHRIFWANCAFKQFNRSIRYDFVGIHICLGARARLPDNKWEMRIKFSRYYVFWCRNYGLSNFFSKLPILNINERCSFFNYTKSLDYICGLLFPSNWKIFQGSLGLCSPILFRWNFNFPEAIFFYSFFSH